MRHATGLPLQGLVFAFACFAIAPFTVSAALTNGGFETGDFTGWTVGGPNGGSGVGLDGASIPGVQSPFPPSFVNVRSGSYAAYGVTANSNGEFLSLSQTVNLQAGLQTAGFYMGNDSNNNFGIDDAISNQRLAIFVNGVHQAFTTRFPANNFPTGSTPSDMFEFSSQFNATGGATLIEFRISGSGTARAGISADDFFVTGGNVIPEPSTLAMFGIGSGILIVSRFRRKR